MVEKAKESSIFSKFLTGLARLSLHSPRGRWILSIFFLRLASRNGVTPSVYGPVFLSRWSDLTFRFCVSGYYGRYLSDFLRNFDSPFSFIDIGANIGLYSMIAARNKRCFRCYAFEPNPAVFKALKCNIELNGVGNIEAVNAAVSERAGTLSFSYVDEHTGAGALAREGDDNVISVASVNRIYFDMLASIGKQTRIVKIDVEGHEPVVIDELIKSNIWDSIEYLYFECDGARYDAQEVIRRLKLNRFRQIHKNDFRNISDLMFQRVH